MAVDNYTIARPYAEAVFACAREADTLEPWSDMLGLLATVVKNPSIAGIVVNPKIDRSTLTGLMLDIAGESLDDEGRNLVRLLVENRRLIVLPEVAGLYETLKNESQGALEVHVASAWPVTSAQERQLAKVLERRLEREIRITSEKDPELIGGVRIRAGDLVIDASVQGQLHQLATELGI